MPCGKSIALWIAWIGMPLAVAPPTTDPTVDWLMFSATTAPATRPPSATQPAAFTGGDNQDARSGVIILSNGRRVAGQITTTAEQPVRVWVETDASYHDLPLDDIRSIEVIVLWERDEREWTFKATGSDEKVYSGRTYPARETRYRFVMNDGTTVTGAVAAPLFVHGPAGDTTFVLHKRDKGLVGQPMATLVFVHSVSFVGK